MKRLIFALVIVAAIAHSAAAQELEMNGVRWNRFNEDMKLGYALGFLQGTSFANDLIVVGFVSVGSDATTVFKAQKLYGDYMRKHFEITVGQVVEGLDSFYKDYRNTNINMNRAVWVVAHAVTGTSQADIDKMTENLRAGVMREPKSP